MFLDSKGRPFFIDLNGRINHILVMNDTIFSYENLIKNEAKRNNIFNVYFVKTFENELGLFKNEYMDISFRNILNKQEFRDLCEDMHPHILV